MFRKIPNSSYIFVLQAFRVISSLEILQFVLTICTLTGVCMLALFIWFILLTILFSECMLDIVTLEEEKIEL